MLHLSIKAWHALIEAMTVLLRVGHDVEQPLMADGRDVEVPGAGYTARLLYKKPAETLKWLEQCGVRKLGNFMVQVTCPHGLHIPA